MKILPTLRTKKQLYEYYALEMSDRDFRFFINTIIEECSPHRTSRCKNLTLKEFLTFVVRFGTPQGYELSNDIKEEIRKRGIN